MRREAWQGRLVVDGVACTRQLLSVELWPALLGWWVIVRCGPVTAWRWRWSARAAAGLFDAAVRTAQEFASSWPDAERRTVLP